MLNKSTAYDILTIALSTGGDFAEIFLENKVSNNISMVNGTLEKSQSGIDYGLGLRIFNETKTIYAYTNDTSKENLITVAKAAAAAVKGKENIKVLDFTSVEIENKHKIKILPFELRKKDVVNLLRVASESSFAYNKAISQTTGLYIDSVQDVLIINSEGLWVTDRRVRARFGISAVASNETEKQTGMMRPGASKGLEFFEEIDMKKLGESSADTAITMLSAVDCPSGLMPVVIDNGFGGVIFHEACGHSLEATAVVKGASVFADKMGQQIASDVVSAVDDGTLENEWGSSNIDDEGMPTQRNLLIENGILKSFLIDRFNGKKMGMKSTGSSRRESYRFAPTSRMTNTFILNGKSTCKDIISDTEYGLYAKQMGGGSVQPATGEFNFSVNEGFMIRNGKIAEPVRSASLIGKGSEVLMKIDKVANNLAQDQGMCGSVSGSIPANVGQPMLRVSEITVGGRG